MVKKDKLIEKLKNSPNNVKFSDIRKLLELEEFFLDRITGSAIACRVRSPKVQHHFLLIFNCLIAQRGASHIRITRIKGLTGLYLILIIWNLKISATSENVDKY